MKHFFRFLVSGFMALALVLPVSAQTYLPSEMQNMEGSLNYGMNRNSSMRLRSFTALVRSVDLQAKTLLIRMGRTRLVRASSALVVTIANDSAKVASLSDLKVGKPAFFVVKRVYGAQSSFDALLIVQRSSTVSQELPTVNFSVDSHRVPESSGFVVHTVNLSKVSPVDVKVQYMVSGTATDATDYTLPSTRELVIPAGQTSASFSLNVADDNMKEPDETVIFTLMNPTNATLGSTSVHTHTIVDND